MSAVGSSPNGNAAIISGNTLTLQPADSSNPGIVSTTTQTFVGEKIFNTGVLVTSCLTGYVDASGTPGNAVINEIGGQVAIAAGAKAVTVTNNKVTATSNVFAVLKTVDSTLTKILTVVPGAGTFTVNCDVNATGTVVIGFQVFN